MKERTPSKKKAKELLKYLKKEGVDYNYLRELFRHLRQELGLKRVAQRKNAPYVPSEEEIKKYYEAAWDGKNFIHLILIKTLLYTGIRVSEIVRVKLEDVDFKKYQICVFDRKKKENRLVPFPKSFKDSLSIHVKKYKKEKRVYLFESSFQENYSDRGIRAILTRYTKKAGIPRIISPQRLRSFLITWLKKEGIDDALIQPYSGHTKKKSLEIYSGPSMKMAQKEYDKKVANFPV